MKLAVSNIAWLVELDAEVFEFLATNGVAGLEVAPTRVWPQWQGISPASVREFRNVVESSGLRVSSLQSILFQKPELKLFGSDSDRQAMEEHLQRCADLAADLGAECMVFGAPRNRDRGSLPEAFAFVVAQRFFARVGGYCAERGVCVGFEANPADYKCNFATDSGAAAHLVREVGSAGFRLHLDTACMHLAGEDVTQAICGGAAILRHVHVSEPFLADFQAPVSAHAEAAAALRSIYYDRWVALEMRSADPPLPALKEAVRFVRGVYGGSA